MINDLGALHRGPKRLGRSIRRGLLVLDELILAFLAKDIRDELARFAERYRVVNVVGEEAQA